MSQEDIQALLKKWRQDTNWIEMNGIRNAPREILAELYVLRTFETKTGFC
jgi:hypothetical protein